MEGRVLEVAPPCAGERLDAFLARELGLPRGYARRLLARGRVEVEGRRARKGVVLRAAERVVVHAFRHPDEGPLPAPELRLPVLARAPGLIAIDKPAGLPTHPLDYDDRHSALGAVLALHPEMRGVGEGGLRSGLVHRLDNDTSGVLVFAHREDAWQAARRAFAERRVEKRYRALVHGRLETEQEVALRLESAGPRVRVVERGGRPTLTRIRPLRAGGDTTLVEVEPLTGHRHQIRATLAWLGHPVVGDLLYGSSVDAGRHLLHATRIALPGFEATSPAPPSIEGAR